MPVYVEVEGMDGTAYHWVATEEVLSKLFFILGEPDIELLQDEAA